LKVALTIYHHAHHTRWDEHLPSLALAFNTTWHESTDTTPAVLSLGREMNHPVGLKWELSQLEQDVTPQDTRAFWERALDNLKKARDRVARRYNAARSEVVFKEGDLVLVKLHPLSSKPLQQSARIASKWAGPFVIVTFLTKVTVQLANPDTGVIVKKGTCISIEEVFLG
jgi:hypothetical protein